MRVSSSTALWRAAIVFLGSSLGSASLASAQATAEPAALARPIAWQEPAPFARLFLQLPFDSPATSPPGAVELGFRLLYSNSFLYAQNDQLALDVHVETAQPTFLVRVGVVPGVEAQLAVPFFVDYGGFLDGPIGDVERLFDAINPQRRDLPADGARYRLTRPGGGGIVHNGAGAGLGDVWGGLKVALLKERHGLELSLRGAIKLPTGRLPYGSEELDAGGGLLAAWTGPSTAVRLQLDVVAPTANLPAAHVATRVYGDLQVGVTQRLGGRVTLHVQASGHLSPLARTGLGQLDAPTAYVLGGVTVLLPGALDLDAAAVENIFSPYRGADITFVLAAARRL